MATSYSYAQTAPTVQQPTAPTTPVVQGAAAPAVTTTTAADGTVVPNLSNEAIQQLQKLTGKKNSQEQIGQVMVIGSLLGCTQKTAGKEATQAFYQQMQAVSKTAEAYCKAGHATEARALLLSTFQQNKTSPVVKAALGCYDTQASSIGALGGPSMAADAARYASWVRDPENAKINMKEQDICRGTPKTAANP